MSSKKLMFQNLMQYVFDKEAIEARDALHETIVEMVFFIKNRTLDSKTVKHEIENQLGLNFDQSLVDEAIAKLNKAGLIKVSRQSGQYFLVPSRKRSLEETIKERKRDLEYLDNKFVSIYRKTVKNPTPEQEKATLEYFYQFCEKLFSSNADLLLGILRCAEKDVKLIESYNPPDRLMREILVTIPYAGIQDGFHKTVIKIFADENILQFLAIIARNYLYFQILNLDPTCKSLQRSVLSKKTLLLDTNFIMSLILSSRMTHKAAVKCVTLSQKLGINLKFTKRTAQEYMTQLNQSEERFRQLGTERMDVLSALDDDFIADYAIMKQKRQTTDWSDHCRRLGMLRNTLAKYGIGEYSSIETDLEVSSIDSRGAIRDAVIKCAAESGNIKNKDVAEHDSYHLLLIRKVREKDPSESTLGPNYWFLTFDSSLFCVDRAINEILGRANELPSSIECWAWTEIILPFLGGSIQKDTAHEAFSYIMKTHFRILPARIDTKKLIGIQTAKVDFNKYTVDEIKAILDDEFVSKYWNDVMKTRWTKQENVKQRAYQKLQERVENVATSISLKRSKVEYAARIASLIMAVLVIAAGIFSVLVQHYSEGAVILLVFGLLFMAMAIGYSRIELFLKEMKLRLKI
jgi:hypothetical protein